ncbi:threonine-phosphate decarboxylase CobD [Thalassospira sp. MA62]|nr:threonine-phosphate decarboxylase CobD [Thalassospira sp. MA62]
MPVSDGSKNSRHPEAPIPHGGAIDDAAEKYGIPTSEWLDLSTGINPQSYPIGQIAPAQWQRLPLDRELQELRIRAARYYGVQNPNQLICAPGTQALIQMLPYWLSDQMVIPTVHVLGPTYGEHARCWNRAGYSCQIHNDIPAGRLKNAHAIAENLLAGDVVVLVNPNNPDGGSIAPDDIAALANQIANHDGWLIVDEAFMDGTPDKSICPHLDGLSRTLVLRSFGKFFGLAGVRLGCAIMPAQLAKDLSGRIGPWAIPGPTIDIANRAFADDAWQLATRNRLDADCTRLDHLISTTTSLKVIGGTCLFGYYHGQESSIIADQLARRAILIRRFDHDDHKLRFGLPGDETGWQRFEVALREMAST